MSLESAYGGTQLAEFHELEVDPRSPIPSSLHPLLASVAWALADGLMSYRKRVDQNVAQFLKDRRAPPGTNPDIVHLFMNPFEHAVAMLDRLGFLDPMYSPGRPTDPPPNDGYNLIPADHETAAAMVMENGPTSFDTLNRSISALFDLEHFGALVSAASLDRVLHEMRNANFIEGPAERPWFAWEAEVLRWLTVGEQAICGAPFESGYSPCLDLLVSRASTSSPSQPD